MQQKISQINYFEAGSCTNYLPLMFKGAPASKYTFPAGVFLLKHRDWGYLLYDTGYSSQLLNWQPKYLLYRLLNPIYIRQEEEIDQQLLRQGIAPEEIRYLILSHLHPDHIGRVTAFPKATILITQSVYDTYQRHRLSDLIFKEFLPDHFGERLRIITDYSLNPAFPFAPTADICQDGSILVASLGGHAAGQACLYLPEKNLFLAADVSWGVDFLPYTQQMRPLIRTIQADFNDYCQTNALLQTVMEAGIQVIVSHDPSERVRRILRET